LKRIPDQTIEYGDFQTPPALARQVCALLARRGIRPAAVVEPTCGVGNVLFAALDRFPTIETAVAGEIHAAHVSELEARSRARGDGIRLEIHQGSAFEIDWADRLARLPGPILVIGNPPWVTNARVGALRGANLPGKSNARGFRGLDAKTGKSNFDISEWMLVRLLEALRSRRGTLAMLCKTAVARKVLAYAWEHGPGLADAEMHAIDAAIHFGANVDACLLICVLEPGCTSPVIDRVSSSFPRSAWECHPGRSASSATGARIEGGPGSTKGPGEPDDAERRRRHSHAVRGNEDQAVGSRSSPIGDRRGTECRVYGRLGDDVPASTFGFRAGRLVADVSAHAAWGHLEGQDTAPRWRSGIKHDCARVMELREEGSRLRNGLGEAVEIEGDFLYPMRKSSDLCEGRSCRRSRWMIVPQGAIGEDTAAISRRAPRTWDYLQEHGEALDRRASSVYRRRPRFAIFGVGPYSFAPWKVAISGLYKGLHFAVVGPRAGKPVVLDDTAYFLPCRAEEEAVTIASLLNSPPARAFYSAFIFWDAKRPVTAEILRRLDLRALAREESRVPGPPSLVSGGCEA
jgi:hypothetical protein